MKIERLRFENLSLQRSEREKLFADLTFDFPLDGVFWIQGATGSGKSTLLRLLAALQEPSSGRYFINRSDVAQMSFEELSPFRLRIGFGFENGGLISNRTIRQNLMLPLFYHRILSALESEARVNEYCRVFRLDGVKDSRPAQVSGGLRKACLVARSLILHPEMLVLDNPSAGLDKSTALGLVDAVQEHRKTKGLRHVFITSDDHEFMRNFDHRIIHIDAKQLRVA